MNGLVNYLQRLEARIAALESAAPVGRPLDAATSGGEAQEPAAVAADQAAGTAESAAAAAESAAGTARTAAEPAASVAPSGREAMRTFSAPVCSAQVELGGFKKSENDQGGEVVRMTSEPTEENRDALRDRISAFLATSPEHAIALREKIRSGELARPTDINDWEAFDQLDYWLQSQGA